MCLHKYTAGPIITVTLELSHYNSTALKVKIL